MTTFNDILYSTGAVLAYTGVGLALLLLGLLVLDWLTPGKLRDLVYVDNNVNAARLATASIAAVVLVIVSAAFSGHGSTYVALGNLALYGVIGIIVQAVAFKILDLVTPGDLGAIVTADTPCPAATVTAAMSLAVGVLVAVALY